MDLNQSDNNMENEKSAVDDFLGNLNEPEKDPFQIDDTVFGDKSAKTDDVAEPKPEKALPFNKDPKVLKFIEKEIEKRASKIEPAPRTENTQTDDEITSVLTRIIGNDTPEKVAVLKDFKKVLGGMEERGAQKAIEQLQSNEKKMREAQEAAEAEAQSELETGFEDIESQFNIDLTSNTAQAKKARGEFVDFIKLVAPKDEFGEVKEYPDLVETFKLHQNLKKANAQPSRAKELASRSMQRSGGAADSRPLGGQGWDAVDRLLNN